MIVTNLPFAQKKIMWFNSSCIAGQRVISTVNYALFAYIDANPIPPIPYLEIFLKIFFYLVVFLLDLIGNSVVIFTIYANKRMRTSSNILIVNLAVSDILVGCFCMWVHLGNHITHNWPFGSFLCKFETFVQVVAVVSSVMTLTSLSVERFHAVMFPTKGKLSKKMLTFLVVFSWIAAIGTSAPNLKVLQQRDIQWRNRRDVWCEEIWPKFYTDTNCNSDEPGRRSYYIFLTVFMYFIPMIVMMLAYGVIGIKFYLRRIPGHEVQTTNGAHSNARKKVTPFMKNVKYIALFLAYSNSAINPIIYAGMTEKFRKGFQDAIKTLQRRYGRNRNLPANNIDGCKHHTSLNVPMEKIFCISTEKDGIPSSNDTPK
ncbi:neuropeptide FF receptor 2-like isoform X2 [Ostrea edulis]|uniref:neuropeptide FF receptor 2-like isoform X2 n=1 Tax=Ostrea edulis TaxID=37623 RepID=UPI0024AF76F4|nr:neuropeptide FF receptor 2-like isoform X2 [Ostrea edulis]